MGAFSKDGFDSIRGIGHHFLHLILHSARKWRENVFNRFDFVARMYTHPNARKDFRLQSGNQRLDTVVSRRLTVQLDPQSGPR